MNTIQVWVRVRPGEWKDWIFTLPTPADCALVQAGLESFYHPWLISDKKYVQILYEIGYGVPIFYDGCY